MPWEQGESISFVKVSWIVNSDNNTNMKQTSMYFVKDFYNGLRDKCEELDLSLCERDDVRIDIHDSHQMDFFLRFEKHHAGAIVAYFVFRTSSWSYEGERTDLHDIESLLFSLVCLKRGMSASIWDVENVFSGIDEELYARYATVVQPSLSVLTDDLVGVKNAHSLLLVYKDFQEILMALVKRSSSKKGYSWRVFCVESLSQKIADIFGTSRERISGCSRSRPDWLYFKIHDENISTIWSKQAVSIVSSILKVAKDQRLCMEDNGISFIKTRGTKNSFYDEDIRRVSKLSGELSGQPQSIFVAESHVFAISGNWIVASRGSYGLDRYLHERKKFSASLFPKIDFLFDGSRLEWHKDAEPGRFEELCRELLAREPNVVRTRQVSPTNQPDRGRDLIIDYVSYKSADTVVMEGEQPLNISRCLVQCKLTLKTLGIPSGIGPVESMFLGDYEGYFLITNSILSSDHTALLEKLRADGRYFVEWWTKFEVEEKLRSHVDILFRYRDVVEYSTFNK